MWDDIGLFPHKQHDQGVMIVINNTRRYQERKTWDGGGGERRVRNGGRGKRKTVVEEKECGLEATAGLSEERADPFL